MLRYCLIPGGCLSNDTIWGIRKAQTRRDFGEGVVHWALTFYLTYLLLQLPYYVIYYDSHFPDEKVEAKRDWMTFSKNMRYKCKESIQAQVCVISSSYTLSSTAKTLFWGHFLNYTTLVLYAQSTGRTNFTLYNYNSLSDYMNYCGSILWKICISRIPNMPESAWKHVIAWNMA